jgi:HK97 gp10 family phage protein
MIRIEIFGKIDVESYAEMIGKSVEVVLPNIGRQIHDRATFLAPVDLGRLRNSISYSVGGKTKGQNSSGGEQVDRNAFVEPSESPTQLNIGTRVEYATAVEFGRPGTPKYPKQPFLRPAFDEIKNKIKEEIAKGIKGTK